MAEFLTMEEGKNQFSSKGKANAGLTLGIIGTALGALGSGIFGGGNGVLGLGSNGNARAAMAGAAGMAAGAALEASSRNNYYPYHPNSWDIIHQETVDQEFDLVKMGDIRYEALRDTMFARERDISEKEYLREQLRRDDRDIRSHISDLKDFTIQGIADVYKASALENAGLAKAISDNRYEGFKNTSDVWRAASLADKNLELQIERNREVDQKEKFDLYKNLSQENSRLAYETMKNSYEERIKSMKEMAALTERVSHLESREAVTSATLPLMFQLSGAHTHSEICDATCKKIDGHLTLGWGQISTPGFPPVVGPTQS